MGHKSMRRWLAANTLIAMILVLVANNFFTFADDVGNKVLLSDYSQIVYDYESGLPSTPANDVIQTKDGYVWIANYSGLIRYDGRKYETFYPNTNGVVETYSIMSLFEDSQGRLWIGTNDKGVILYRQNTFIGIECDELKSVTGFAEKSDGTIFIGSKEGLFVSTDGNTAIRHETVRDSVDTLCFDKRDRLWVVDKSGSVRLPDSDGINVNSNSRFSGIFCDSQGNVFLGCENGDVLVINDMGEIAQTINTKLNRINDFCQDNKGRIWLCSNLGIGYIDELSQFHLAKGSKITSSVEAIAVDDEDGIWAASSRNGVIQLIPSSIRNVSFAADLGEHVTNSAIDYNGNTYIAADDGLIIVNSEYVPIQNSLTDMLQNTRVRSLTIDSKGNLWISTYEKHGVIILTPEGNITKITNNEGLISNRARFVMETAAGDVYAATSDGISIINGDKVTKSYDAGSGLDNTVVLSMAEMADGSIYIGTDGGGIFKLLDGVITPVNLGEMDSQVILRMYRDDDALWIATGASFYCYKDEKLTRMAYITNELRTIFDIVKDHNGKLWIFATDGIVSGTQEDLIRGDQSLTYIRRRDGFPYHVTANSWSHINENGKLYVCGISKLGCLDTENFTAVKRPVRLIIEGFDVDGDALPVSTNFSASNIAQRLTVRVQSPNFNNNEEIKFEYYLEGFESTRHYMIAGRTNDITYTNLSGGTYYLHIRAINEMGQASAERVIKISKEYGPWERPITWVLAGLFVLAFVVMIARYIIQLRTRKILRKQEEYRNITNQVISTISNTIDAKDKYTEGHSKRVAQYAVEVGRRLGMNEDQIEKLRYIAQLHDIGKIGISDAILNKPERLTEEEFQTMKRHTVIGGDILKDLTSVPDISEGASAHHEKYNGTGYPHGLKGDEISLNARIIGVCDTFDAMNSTRTYRVNQSTSYILDELKQAKGTQLDPEITQIMIDMINEGFTTDTMAY